MSLAARIAKVYVQSNPFKGIPKKTDLKLVEEALQPLKDGEYLAEAVFLRVNPNPQVFTSGCTTGTFPGTQVAKVIESKNKKFPVGKYIVGEFGWRTLTIGNGTLSDGLPSPYPLPEVGKLPKSVALGSLGTSGNAAYFGFMQICKPKEGDTVVISGAGGAVGSHVGQLAKLTGCKVIGIAGSDEKGTWLLNDLGFDHFINYKKQDVGQKLEEYAPSGIDCYFDNVGGEISSAVIYRMKPFGRVCICGASSLYHEAAKAAEVQTPIKIKHVHMEGMLVSRWLDEWSEGITQNWKWFEQGKLKYRETVIDGFEKASEAFVDTLQGQNIGNVIVKC